MAVGVLKKLMSQKKQYQNIDKAKHYIIFYRLEKALVKNTIFVKLTAAGRHQFTNAPDSYNYREREANSAEKCFLKNMSLGSLFPAKTNSVLIGSQGHSKNLD